MSTSLIKSKKSGSKMYKAKKPSLISGISMFSLAGFRICQIYKDRDIASRLSKQKA